MTTIFPTSSFLRLGFHLTTTQSPSFNVGAIEAPLTATVPYLLRNLLAMRTPTRNPTKIAAWVFGLNFPNAGLIDTVVVWHLIDLTKT